MNLVKNLLILSILSVIPGQLIRIPVFSQAVITISDICVFFTVTIGLFYILSVKKSLKIDPKIAVSAALFVLVALASTIAALQNFSQREVLIASLFLVRFVLYFMLFFVVSNIFSKKDVIPTVNILIATTVLYTLIGLIQYVFFSDLTALSTYGWDPHIKRLVSTFIDPNFSGGLMSVMFAISMSLFLTFKNKVYLLAAAIFFTGIILTFSRSSYLALSFSIATLGLLKSPKLLLAFIAVFIFAFFTISPVRTRIEGAFNVDETSQARIESWQKAITIYSQNPILGVGFNTYRYAQANYGFFPQGDPEGGHSGAGSDSSILLVAATSGTIGLFAYLFLLTSILVKFAKGISSPLNLGALSAFLGLLVHSQFVNSLFFPQIMLIIWVILGLSDANDS